MQRLEVSGAVRPIYGSLSIKRLTTFIYEMCANFTSSDEDISGFRNVVIIQCGVVFVTLWEQVLLFSADVLQVAVLSRNLVPMCCKWLYCHAI